MEAGDPFLSWVLTYNTSYLLLAIRSTWRSYLLRRSIPLRDDGDPEIYRVTGPKVYANNRKGRDSNLEVFPWGWGQKATADMPECQ